MLFFIELIRRDGRQWIVAPFALLVVLGIWWTVGGNP